MIRWFNKHPPGQRFISALIVLLTVTVIVYVCLHWYLRSQGITGKITWHSFAAISEVGEVRFLNLGDLNWYLGADTSIDKIRDLRDRSAEIVQLNIRVRGQLLPLSRRVINQELVQNISKQILAGNYPQAYEMLSGLEADLSSESLARINFQGIKDDIIALERLKLEQLYGLEDLNPPHASLFFWTSPNLSILEVWFWALFGVCTNLLVNSAEYLRKRNFNPDERWVAYTKLLYGPILAMVLVLAIMFGWLDLGPYEARVWTLPLVGFIFGYASRRTARLFGRLQEKVLGAAEQSVEAGPEKILEERKRTLEALREASTPVSLQDLKQMAKEFARQQINVEAGLQGAKK